MIRTKTKEEETVFRTKGEHFGQLVKWSEGELDNCGVIEAQNDTSVRIYVLNKHTYGKSRAVKRMSDVLFI